ncbi:sensor histidine kinase [Vagococcus zengguangii]|nr:sensor histidine kinase [Vagococcus zengguangii]
MRYQSFWGNVTSEQRDYITSIETLSHTIITQQQQHIRDVEQEAHRLIAEWEDYYSVWSHQIKTPLASLQLQADTDNLSKASVKNEVNKIEHYVKMMIYYLKANHLSNDIALTNIEVDKIIKSLLREHAHFFIQNDLTVNLDVRKLQVLSDEKWLRFILEQLLINAVKYTLQGAITIRSSQFQQLEIIDTGIGILPEDLPRVFEKGYTGYNGRTQHKATGLGLYMVKKLADELNIKLIIESTVGKGTSVRLIFPKNHV